MKTAKRFPTLAATLVALALTFFACSSSSEGIDTSSNSLACLIVTCEAHDADTHFCDERDGKIYKKVTIGTQTWMAENLNYAATDGECYQKDSSCYQNNDSNCAKYGRLYNWAIAMNVCPSGWHLPSDIEWSTLTQAVGGTDEPNYLTGAGIKLKASNPLWTTNTGTDDFGFSALPGGYGGSNGNFGSAGSGAYFWGSTQNSATGVYYRRMSGSDSNVGRFNGDKSYLYSIRCIQN
jgi:uncharacterized protein (TIGR02145 family)